MIRPDFIIEFNQLFTAAALACGIRPDDCVIGTNKTDIADQAKGIPALKVAFINIIPDLSGMGDGNDQLGDQLELLFFFVEKYDRRNKKEFLQVMNQTLNTAIQFRQHILSGEGAADCSWRNLLDWSSLKIAPESNLYEMSGWMLTLKSFSL